MRFMLMLEAADPGASDHAFDAGAVAALERYGALLLGAGVLLEAARLQSPGGGATVWLSHPRGAQDYRQPARTPRRSFRHDLAGTTLQARPCAGRAGEDESH